MIGDDERTKLSQAPSPDDQATRAHADVGVVAELRAVFGNGEKKTLPLYALPDTIVVGRGTAADWQLDDPSLSRKHCQIKWNGKALSVEDLGSANGTRVGARSARTSTPVGPDDVITMGTVVISFVPLMHADTTGGVRNPDAESTRIVQAPIPAGGAAETTPGPLSPVATVVKPAAHSGPPNAAAAVFRPDRDAAGPDEKTRLWDASAALVHAPERAIDAEALKERLVTAWRTNRRPFVLGGAALWIAILLGIMALKQAKPSDDEFVAPPAKQMQPVVTQLPTTTPSGEAASANANGNVVEPSTDRDQDLADAIAAYDNGRPQEALRYFRRLATDPNDKVARFMVTLIESRGATTP